MFHHRCPQLIFVSLYKDLKKKAIPTQNVRLLAEIKQYLWFSDAAVSLSYSLRKGALVS